MLQFKSHTLGDIVVADFNVPSLCDGPEFEQTSERLHGIVNSARSKTLIIDLAKVNFIASSTLAVLMALQNAVTANGGTLHICGLGKQLQQIFRLSGLDRYLTLHANREQALATIRGVSV